MIGKAALCLLLSLSSVTSAQHKLAYEEVTIPNGNIALSGTLTVPAADAPVPAVILISGSGPHDRNETMMGKKPFLVIAEYLTRHGIAVLRYDDRGTNRSTGDYTKALLADFATDAQAAFSFLKNDPRIDPGKTGILGHSEGAMIGQIMAAGEAGPAFFVSLAGPALDGIASAKKQFRLMHAHLPEPQRNRIVNLEDSALLIVVGDKDTAVAHPKLRQFIEAQYYRPENGFDKNIDKDIFERMFLETYTAPITRDRFLHDPSKYFPRIKCPVLAINGDKDIHVECQSNLQAWKKGLTAAGNPKVTVKTFPGLNHLFQHCKSCTMFEYGQLPETISPEVLAYIQAWIATQTGLKKSGS